MTQQSFAQPSAPADYSIVIAGQAGQGIRTIETLFTRSLHQNGIYFHSSSEFMSRVRGGHNSTEIRVGSRPLQAFVTRIDLLLVLGTGTQEPLDSRLGPQTRILGSRKHVHEGYREKYSFTHISFQDLAKEAGHPVVTNTVVLGLLLALLNLDPGPEKAALRKTFAPKGARVIEMNLTALEMGWSRGRQVDFGLPISGDFQNSPPGVCTGTEAVSLGALAGGCNFITAYPMSPGTGVITFMAQYARRFGVVVEQSEDEIAAFQMMLGAWYAGGRGMVTTSGGGFSLMQEGISLAGITETPAVIHLAQRPGPATGLPTRTEQGDLNLAVYAGHGEFPRIILAPGNLKDAMILSRRAFDLADRYRMIVIILTDQYLLDSRSPTEIPDLGKPDHKNFFEKQSDPRPTYRLTASGISPRTIPGIGRGLQQVDSHEHDEYGHLTEDPELRVEMVNKRLEKYRTMAPDFFRPELHGSEKYDNLIIGWGSTRGVILEVLKQFPASTAFAHFKQVYPLHPDTSRVMKNARTVIVVENNAGGQFGQLLQQETGIEIHHRILQYNGRPFSVEELTRRLGEIL